MALNTIKQTNNILFKVHLVKCFEHFVLFKYINLRPTLKQKCVLTPTCMYYLWYKSIRIITCYDILISLVVLFFFGGGGEFVNGLFKMLGFAFSTNIRIWHHWLNKDTFLKNIFIIKPEYHTHTYIYVAKVIHDIISNKIKDRT